YECVLLNSGAFLFIFLLSAATFSDSRIGLYDVGAAASSTALIVAVGAITYLASALAAGRIVGAPIRGSHAFAAYAYSTTFDPLAGASYAYAYYTPTTNLALPALVVQLLFAVMSVGYASFAVVRL